MRWLWAALVASGCLKSSAQPCSSGGESWVCPAGFACAEVGAYCGPADEVAACAGQGEFGSCTIESDGVEAAGRCTFGVCNACDPATEADLEGCTYTGWKAMTTPTGAALNGVWSVAPADAYVVGDNTVLHYDGNSWSTPPGLPSLASASLGAVWASGSDDVFVVASVGAGLGGDILQFDGTTWSATPAGASSESLDAVWGASSNDVYAVGGEVGSAGVTGVVRQFDGSAWTTIDVGKGAFAGVWASSDLAVAVGNDLGSGVIWHSSAGGAWTQDMVPPGTTALTGVWGSSDTDIFAIGGDVDPQTGDLVIIHYDGSSWSLLASCGTSPCITPQLLATVTVPLAGITGRSAGNIYAVGNSGAILDFDGNEWTSDPTSPTSSSLTGVAAGSNEVFVIGTGEIFRETN